MRNGAPVDIGPVLDEGPWTRHQKLLVLFTAATIVFDGVDNQLLGVAIPTIMREWSVPRSAFAPVISLGYVGMMIGGAAAGVVGDRVGRRTALLTSMVVFGLMTVLAPTVGSPEGLTVLRFLAGVGLGGALPNAAALAAEYVPRHQRPIAVTVTIVCVPVGAALAGLLGIRLLQAIGWRWLFAIGGIVPIIAAAILARALPESPRYLARHPDRWPELVVSLRRMGHMVESGARFVDSTEAALAHVSRAAMLQAGLRGDTLALWAAFTSCLLAVYLGFSWLTSLLAGAGFEGGSANTGLSAFNLGGVAGALLGGSAIARFGSRAAMLVMAAGAVIGAVVLASMSIAPGAELAPIIAMLAVTGGLINAVQTTMYALAAHVYPSAIRATGVGAAVAIGRVGAISSGYVGAWALDVHGSRAYFLVMAATMGATFVALALVRRHVPPSTRRRASE